MLQTKEQMQIPDKITLNKIQGHELWVTDEDGRTSHIKAIYKDKRIATIDSATSGAWGGAGIVKTSLLFTDGEKLYRLEPLGNFVDEERKYKEVVLNKIKAKLTQEEADFLGI